MVPGVCCFPTGNIKYHQIVLDLFRLVETFETTKDEKQQPEQLVITCPAQENSVIS